MQTAIVKSDIQNIEGAFFTAPFFIFVKFVSAFLHIRLRKDNLFGLGHSTCVKVVRSLLRGEIDCNESSGRNRGMRNHLRDEKSPYLRQHAGNPVDWYPWGKEAFEKARKEEKPILLSIGYSTCHWCHVMAHESFEDDKVAEVLNRDFVSIKVDREERPDIDSVYMSVCQAMNGTGGWPLTILMTPEQKPFFAGTYLPKTARYGSLGFLELLERAAEKWKKDRKLLVEAGDQIAEEMREITKRSGTGAEPTLDFLKEAAETLQCGFDNQWGGFGTAPKFPMPHVLLFLLRYAKDEREGRLSRADVLWMVEKTLDQMYRGGIFDHLAGGFSRYSTDHMWLVPHFEKMLYDNALLAYVYAEAGQRLGRPLYLDVTSRILEYVQEELTHPEGGFYSGQDADSEGEEGKYYLFTPNEIKSRLGTWQGHLFCKRYGITEEGNFQGKSVPNLIEISDITDGKDSMEMQRMQLASYRKARYPLATDDKILTAWNGLMIAALAKAARIFGGSAEESKTSLGAKYRTAAEKAQQFIEKHLTKEDGQLYARWRDGEAAHDGKLDDYAFYAWALLELYETTLNAEYLKKAVSVADLMMRNFYDRDQNGFYFSPHGGEELLFRVKETGDDALPSGNSVAAYVLSKLSHLTGEVKWREASEKQIRFLAREASDDPSGFCFGLLAFMEEMDPSSELVCVAAGKEETSELMQFMDRVVGNLSVVLKTPENEKILKETAPFTRSYPIPAQGVDYYLCRGGSCKSPMHDLDSVIQSLQQ